MTKCYNCGSKPHFICSLASISNVAVCLDCYNNDIRNQLQLQHDLLIGEIVVVDIYDSEGMSQKVTAQITHNHVVDGVTVPGLYHAKLSKMDAKIHNRLSLFIGLEDLK